MDDNATWNLAVGAAIETARRAADVSAVQLAVETAELGTPIHRVAISKIESGTRQITIPELVVIASALGRSPVSLLFANVLAPVEVLPGLEVPGTEALGWFIGIGTGEPARIVDDPELGTGLFWATRNYVKESVRGIPESAMAVRLVEVEEALKVQRDKLDNFESVPESPLMSETQKAIRRENIEHARRVLDLLADEWRDIAYGLEFRHGLQADESRLDDLTRGDGERG